MFEYLRLVFQKASKGFALRIDLWYGVAGVIVAGLTGSKARPMGDLTPFELARYLLVAVVSWWLFRLVLLAPYRIWQEQRATIGGLQEEVGRPERLGAEAMHRIRAEKRIDLAAKIQEYHWTAATDADATDAHYTELMRLTAQANVPKDFKWLLGEFVEMAEDEEAPIRAKCHNIVNFLCGFLHNEYTAGDLKSLRAEYEK